MVTHFNLRSSSLGNLLLALAEANSCLTNLVALEGTVPGGDDTELRGILLQVQVITAQVAGIATANEVQKDGR
jgi:hypothetical protein